MAKATNNAGRFWQEQPKTSTASNTPPNPEERAKTEENWWKEEEPQPKPTPKPKSHSQSKEEESTGAASYFFKEAYNPSTTPSSSSKSARQREKAKAKKAKEEKKMNEKQKQKAQWKEEQEAEKKAEEARRRAEAEAKAEAEEQRRNIFHSEFPKLFDAWQESCTAYFSNQTNIFPKPPKVECKNHGRKCIRAEKLSICHHELRLLLQGTGNCTEAWLKKERLRFHPDRFSKDLGNQQMATELFQLIQQILDDGK